MNEFLLSVLIPLQAGGHVVHVYRIEHAQSLEWTRAHADELARRMHGGAYVALLVEPAPGALTCGCTAEERANERARVALETRRASVAH